MVSRVSGGIRGKGFPMWNGIWKLTVMVGVIGVGLFAVYQAQQGMNRVASVQPAEDLNEPDPSAEPTETDENGVDAPTSVSIHDFSRKRSTSKLEQPAESEERSRIDLVGRFRSDNSTVKPAVGTRSGSIRQVAAVDLDSRPKGLDFRETIELDELDESEPAAEAPQSLPEDGDVGSLSTETDLDSLPMKDEVSEVDEEAPSEVKGAPEPLFDPFDEPPAQKPETPSESNVEDAIEPDEPAEKIKSPAKAPSGNQAPARKLIDFGNETDIPRSKRATSGKGKIQEPPAAEAPSFDEAIDESATEPEPQAEPDSEPFDRGSKSKPDALDSEESAEDNASLMEAPPSFDELPSEDGAGTKEEFSNSREESLPDTATEPSPALGSPSSDTLSNPPSLFPEAGDEAAPPPQAKKRMTLPGLSVDSEQDAPVPERSSPGRKVPEPEMFERDVHARDESDREPFRGRESSTRRADPESVSPSDLVGDGLAGDPSQRGVQQPRLTIEKVAQHQAVIDQPLIYTIIVRNTGNVVAHNVVVEDRIPKGTELMGTSPRAELVGKRLIWNELVLKPNEEKKISIKVIPKQEGPIGSVARLYFATEVSAEIQVATPQLEFTLKAPDEVRPGQTVDLTFYLKNVGTVDASNILVRDLIPENFKHDEGLDIECAIGKLSPNEVREIVLPITAMATGMGVNRAVLTADSGIKKELDHSINVVGEVLVLTRSGHNRVYVSRPATFTSSIRNDGNQRVANVRISEVVPAGMEFETASDGGRYDPRQRAVHWTLGPLGPGDDRAVSVKYVPKETGTHVGKVTATGASGSSASVDSSVEVVGRPELQMESLSTTGVVTVGDRITSKMQLKNSGTASAKNVRLSLRLPPELRLVEVRGRKFQQKDDRVIFEPVEDLPPKGNVAFEVMLEPIQEAEAKMQLEISAEHLSKPHRRDETIQIVQDALK